MFGAAAVGVASVAPCHKCDCDEAQTAPPRKYALACDLSAHVNVPVVGFAFGFVGAMGPAQATYQAFTVSLELGWFGR